MLTQKNGSIWLLSTPKDTEGFFHREFTEGTEDWRRVVVPATECPRFTPEQLASEKATLGARKFAQEFLCEFVSTNDGMFNQEWFEAQRAQRLVHQYSMNTKAACRWNSVLRVFLKRCFLPGCPILGDEMRTRFGSQYPNLLGY